MSMMLKCSECKHKFESLLIDNKLAFADIYKSLMDHVMTAHRSIAESLAPYSRGAIESLLVVFTMKSFAEIDDDQEVLDELIADAQGVVMNVMGYEEVDNGEQEEDDEEDEEEEERKPTVFDPEQLVL